MKFHAALAGTLLAAACLAQSTVTIPVAYTTTEGPTNSAIWMPIFGSSGQGRYQWSTSSLRGAPIVNINKAEYRRDGLQAASTLYGPRTTTLSLVMAHCNAAALTTTYASNYVGSPTTCVAPAPFNFPDHTNPPATTPAPWTVSIPFTTNFTYNGTNDLMWEIVCTGTTPTGSYSIDGVAGTGFGTVGTSAYLGVPCSGTGIIKLGPTLLTPTVARLGQYALGCPATQPGIISIGLTNPNTNFGGLLCQPLYADPLITLGVTSDASGNVYTSAAPLNLDIPAPAGPLNVFTQFIVFNPTSTFGIPVHMTDGIQWSLTAPVAGNGLSLLYSDTSATALTGSRSTSSMAIVRFTY